MKIYWIATCSAERARQINEIQSKDKLNILDLSKCPKRKIG